MQNRISYNGSLVSKLAQTRGIFSLQLWALPALFELFVLWECDLEQAGGLHQRGHHCLPFPYPLVEIIQHLVRTLAVKPGGMYEPTQASITHTHRHTHLNKLIINQGVFKQWRVALMPTLTWLQDNQTRVSSTECTLGQLTMTSMT